MKDILNHLYEHKTLNREEAREVLKNIAQGKYNPIQIASFLTVYIMRSITVDELEGFRQAMLDLCIVVDLKDYNPIDLCGTGGDGKNTFNISTLSAFVVAASGIPVAKHGNHGVSSVSGSSTVLEQLGVKFNNDEAKLRACIEKTKICFLHAPLFHPAMKNVGPVRKDLGVKTFFNMLGPMVNPAFPKKQMVGVFSLELARLYTYLFQKTDAQFRIVHALDGYDEISLTGAVKVFSKQKEEVFQPEDLELPTLNADEIRGGETIYDSAKIFYDILDGKGTEAQNAVVIANSGMAIQAARPEENLMSCLALAKDTLLSGKAKVTFEKFVQISKN